MIRFHHRETGDSVVPVILVPASDSVAYVAGGLGNLESGLLTLAAAADSAIVGVINETITTETSTTEEIEVIPALGDVVFIADVYTGGTKKTLTNADIGTAFDLYASDLTKVALDDTTGGMMVYVGGWDATAKTGLFKILAASRAAIVG